MFPKVPEYISLNLLTLMDTLLSQKVTASIYKPCKICIKSFLLQWSVIFPSLRISISITFISTFSPVAVFPINSPVCVAVMVFLRGIFICLQHFGLDVLLGIHNEFNFISDFAVKCNFIISYYLI